MRTENRSTATAPEPRRPRWVALATPLVLLAAACVSADPEPDVATTQAPLVTELPPVNPVVVTTGTCLSTGYQPIATQERCDEADAILFAEGRATSGSLRTPPVLDPSGTPNPSFAPTPACSVGSRAGSEGARSELLAIFRSDTPEAMEAQACSHDHPCVCDEVAEVPAAPLTSACRDGEFQPDPKRYYTIKSPNGRYLRAVGTGDSIIVGSDISAVLYSPIAGDALQPYTKDFDSFQTLFTAASTIATPSEIRFQWRFAPDQAGAGYRPINRDTGQPLTASPLFSVPGTDRLALASESTATAPFTFTCRGSQVVMTQGSFSPFDTGGQLADSPRTSAMTSPLVMGTPGSPGAMSRTSNCMKKSRTCASVFGPEFVQTKHEKCGAFNQLKILTCTNTLGVPVSMHLPQTWYIDEVDEFKRAVDLDAAPIVVKPLTSALAVSNSMATFGASAAAGIGGGFAAIAGDVILATSGPVVGAMVSLGLGFLPGGAFDVNAPDPVAELAQAVTDALVQLKNDLSAQTAVLIANAVGQEAARQLTDNVSSRREDFYVDYVGRRANLSVDNVTRAAALHTEIRGIAQEFDNAIDVLFPSICTQPCQPNSNDLVRAHFGMVSAKLAVTEALIMQSEATLMEALADPDSTCTELLDDNSIPFHVTKYRRILTNAVDGLVVHGLASTANRVNRSASEFEFDARNFSYDVSAQLAFLDRIAEDTLAKCERLRDPNDTFRRHYIENTLDLPPCFGDDATGDSDGSGTCDGAVAAMAGPWTALTTTGTNAGITDPILADLDGDGDLDLVTRHHNERRLVQWTNADGVLAEGASVATACKPFDLALSDLDGDGDLDLVAGGVSNNKLVVAEQTGTGFGAPGVISSGPLIKRALAMDVDDDGRPDLVVFDDNSRQLLLHRNASDGAGISLAAATVIDGSLSSNTFGGPGLAALDVDGDGDLDLVVAAAQLRLYRNEAGTFGAPTTVDAADLGADLYLADLDRDGDEDLVGISGGSAVWYPNLGTDGFGAQRSVAANLAADALAVGDLDGDGDADVVVRDAGTGQLVWVENGKQGLVVRAPIGVAQDAFAVGDVDGDGDGDLVAVDPATSGVVTWLNPLF